MGRRFLRLRLTMRWWVPLYIQGVQLMSMVTGRDPDYRKVDYWLKKGFKAEVVED